MQFIKFYIVIKFYVEYFFLLEYILDENILTVSNNISGVFVTCFTRVKDSCVRACIYIHTCRLYTLDIISVTLLSVYQWY